MTNHFIIDTFDWSRNILANCWRSHSYIQILFRALEAQSEEEPSADAEALTMYIVSVWPVLTVTTRTIPFLLRVFYKPLFAIVTGGGHIQYCIFLYIHAPSTIHILNMGSAKSLKGSRKQTMMNIDGIDWIVGELKQNVEPLKQGVGCSQSLPVAVSPARSLLFQEPPRKQVRLRRSNGYQVTTGNWVQLIQGRKAYKHDKHRSLLRLASISLSLVLWSIWSLSVYFPPNLFDPLGWLGISENRQSAGNLGNFMAWNDYMDPKIRQSYQIWSETR